MSVEYINTCIIYSQVTFKNFTKVNVSWLYICSLYIQVTFTFLFIIKYSPPLYKHYITNSRKRQYLNCKFFIKFIESDGGMEIWWSKGDENGVIL